MNPVPDKIKLMIRNDSNILNRLKTNTYLLEQDKRLWTFPRFEPPRIDRSQFKNDNFDIFTSPTTKLSKT